MHILVRERQEQSTPGAIQHGCSLFAKPLPSIALLQLTGQTASRRWQQGARGMGSGSSPLYSPEASMTFSARTSSRTTSDRNWSSQKLQAWRPM